MLDGMSLSDRFHFRDETIEVIAGGGGNITWETAGPVLTIQPGGRFILDDPHTVRDDDTVTRLPIETAAARMPGMVAVTSGLEGGERVITRGSMRLQDGATVDPRRGTGTDGAPGQ